MGVAYPPVHLKEVVQLLKCSVHFTVCSDETGERERESMKSYSKTKRERERERTYKGFFCISLRMVSPIKPGMRWRKKLNTG